MRQVPLICAPQHSQSCDVRFESVVLGAQTRRPLLPPKATVIATGRAVAKCH